MINYKKLQEIIKKRPAISIGGIAFMGLIAWGFISLLTGEDAESSVQNYTVKQGPLRISITETGTIQPKDKTIIKNQVEGTTAITYLVDEGINVKQGDLLMSLDSSSLSDKVTDQEISVQNAAASNIEASENYEVAKNQAQSDIESAQLTYDFAQQDLKKYVEGEYPDALKEAESNITLAEQELSQAQDKLDWDKKLYAEQYLSQTELNTDTLSYNQKKLAVELKKAAKELLENFTYKRQLAKLQSDVTQAKSALERTTRKAKANVAQAEASKAAKQAEYERQLAKLQKYKNQLEYTQIYAPVDGNVIYATSAEQSQHRHGSRTEPLKVGNNVQERQELIHLPTTSGFVVNISIPESSLDEVKVGLQAKVTVDTIPNVVFTGTVTSVSNVVNAQDMFSNPDLKVYDTVIALEKSGGDISLLRSGMSCTAEIIVRQYDNAIYVPMQAVLNVGGKPTVYIVKGDKMKPRTVETGLDNSTVITIASGLKPGEIISLTPPLAQAAVVDNSFEKLSDLVYAPAVNTPGATMSNNQNAGSASPSNVSADNQTAGSGKDDNTPAAQGGNKGSVNRYSTTGPISDSSNSEGGPGDGGMPDGGGMPDHDDD